VSSGELSAREVLQRLRREIAIDSDPLWVLNWQQAVDRDVLHVGHIQ
jgi:hypothetical protein